jgi:hypothetical protein
MERLFSSFRGNLVSRKRQFFRQNFFLRKIERWLRASNTYYDFLISKILFLYSINKIFFLSVKTIHELIPDFQVGPHAGRERHVLRQEQQDGDGAHLSARRLQIWRAGAVGNSVTRGQFFKAKFAPKHRVRAYATVMPTYALVGAYAQSWRLREF